MASWIGEILKPFKFYRQGRQIGGTWQAPLLPFLKGARVQKSPSLTVLFYISYCISA